ncbi:hypothetical protein SRHO_G00008870 [Serrasalmus rhombeus]
MNKKIEQHLANVLSALHFSTSPQGVSFFWLEYPGRCEHLLGPFDVRGTFQTAQKQFFQKFHPPSRCISKRIVDTRMHCGKKTRQWRECRHTCEGQFDICHLPKNHCGPEELT